MRGNAAGTRQNPSARDYLTGRIGRRARGIKKNVSSQVRFLVAQEFGRVAHVPRDIVAVIVI